MSSQTAQSARQLALNALLDRSGMVTARLERLMSESDCSSADKAMAMELAMGVVRRRRTLDEVIRAFSRNPNGKMPAVVRQLLRMGVYQLVFMNRTPDYAAVNETVEACKRRRPRQSGFVNALLRKLIDSLGEVQYGTPKLDRRTIWINDSSYRCVDRDMYPDIDEKAAAFFGSVVSLPDALAARWIKRRKKMIDSAALAMQINARPPVILRVNLARTTVGEILTELSSQSIEAEAHVNGRSIVLAGGTAPGTLDCFKDGRVSPQDPTATAAGDALDVRPGMRVLDFCAAPGGKTMQIAEKLNGTGSMLAVDVNEARIQKIQENIARCGWENIELRLAGEVGALEQCSFDRVLVDAPCSNTGVLARRVEARWRFDETEFRKLCVDQRQILRIAEMFLKPGGKLLYSTCSVEPQENDNVISSYLKGDSRLHKEMVRHTDPKGFAGLTHYCDGGYLALLS